MKKILFVLLLISAFIFPVIAGVLNNAGQDSPRGNIEVEVVMAYCTLTDLQGVYGEDRITAWSRFNPDAIDLAINNASAEIDGYLISGGYSVPLVGPPKNLCKYCVDIAAAGLVLNAGVLDNDPGGNAVLEAAKNARRYLEKVAEGKFKIPGYANGNEEVSIPSGGVLVSSRPRMDFKGF